MQAGPVSPRGGQRPARLSLVAATRKCASAAIEARSLSPDVVQTAVVGSKRAALSFPRFAKKGGNPWSTEG